MFIKDVRQVSDGVRWVAFRCGCEAQVNKLGHIFRGTSCSLCIEDMSWHELKNEMTQTIARYDRAKMED